MATPVKLKRFGSAAAGEHNYSFILRKLAQQDARRAISGVAALTQSSGGTAGTILPVAATVGAAVSGTNLAGKASTEAALNTVLDAVGELYTKANAMATILAVPTVTNNAGGTAPDGTVGAITVATTGAATGVLVANTNVMIAALNKAMYNLAGLVKGLCRATHNTEPVINFGSTGVKATTIAAITIDGGTAATPAVTKVEADAALVVYRTNIKTLGDILNTIIATQTALVVAS
jgi:hypothetical protein